MGWKLKALALVVALVLLEYGAWMFAIPFSLYAFSRLVFRLWRRPTRNSVSPASKEAWRRTRTGPFRLFGALLLILALAGIIARGTLSPFVFGIPGLAVLLWGPLSRSSLLGGLAPVTDSILLRRSLNPFSWLALAEVKFLTRDVAKALAGVSGRLLVATSEESSIYVAARVAALSRGGAERKIMEQLGEVNRTTAPLGAYLLPLDGERAGATLGVSVEPVEMTTQDLPSFLSSSPYDLLSLETEYGLLKSMGVYRKSGSRKDGRASAVPSRIIAGRPPFVSEVLRSVGLRVEWPNPDEYTAFLMSMFATRFATQELRVTESASPTNSQVILVRSLASPQVELSRAQLRAIHAIYETPANGIQDSPTVGQCNDVTIGHNCAGREVPIRICKEAELGRSIINHARNAYTFLLELRHCRVHVLNSEREKTCLILRKSK